MFVSMVRQEVAFHDLDANRSSVLTTQLASVVPFCKCLSSDKLGLICQGFAGIGFAISLAFFLNWQLALVMLCFIPFIFGAGVLQGRSSTNQKINGVSVVEEGGRLTIETVENIKTVISLGREKYFMDEFEAIFESGFKRTLLFLHLQAFFYGMSNSFRFYIQAAAFSFGFYLFKKNDLTVTDFYRIYAPMLFSSMMLGRVYAQIPDQTKA